LGERALARARFLGQPAWLEGDGNGAVRADRCDTLFGVEMVTRW